MIAHQLFQLRLVGYARQLQTVNLFILAKLGLMGPFQRRVPDNVMVMPVMTPVGPAAGSRRQRRGGKNHRQQHSAESQKSVFGLHVSGPQNRASKSSFYLDGKL